MTKRYVYVTMIYSIARC